MNEHCNTGPGLADAVVRISRGHYRQHLAGKAGPMPWGSILPEPTADDRAALMETTGKASAREWSYTGGILADWQIEDRTLREVFGGRAPELLTDPAQLAR